MQDSTKPRTCEVHENTMALIAKLDNFQVKLMEGQMEIKENLIRLTENILEMKRLNQRFDDMARELKVKDEKQDKEIHQNSAFVNKALGVVGSISIIAVIATGLMAILTYLFK